MKEEKRKGEIWKPKKGELFWRIGTFGAVSISSDEDFLGIGNCYPTQEKAQFEANREKYTRLFRQYVEQHSEPLNWKDDNQEKWYVCYDTDTDNIRFESMVDIKCMDICGSSEEVMRDAVAFIGEENVKRYILSVEE